MIIPKELVQKRSYEIWQREGRPAGFDLVHWFRAKAELEAEFRDVSLPFNNSECGFVVPRPRISRLPCRSVSQRIAWSPSTGCPKAA